MNLDPLSIDIANKSSRSRVILFCFAISLLSLFTAAAYSSSVIISLDGTEILTDKLCRDESDNLYLKTGYFCRVAGVQYHLEKDKSKLFLKKGKSILCLDLQPSSKNITRAQLNNEYCEVSPRVLIYSDCILIPLTPVSRLLGMQLEIKAVQPTASQRPYKHPSSKTRKQVPRKDSKKIPSYLNRDFPRFGIKTGFWYFKPSIENLDYDGKWRLVHGLRFGLNKNTALELQFNTFKDEKAGILLNQPATISVDMGCLTGYFLFTFPINRWNLSAGLGYGEQKYDLHYDSQALNSTYSRWFRLGVTELKLASEYMITNTSSIEFVTRILFAKNENIPLKTIDSTIRTGYDDIYFGLNHTLYFR